MREADFCLKSAAVLGVPHQVTHVQREHLIGRHLIIDGCIWPNAKGQVWRLPSAAMRMSRNFKDSFSVTIHLSLDRVWF